MANVQRSQAFLRKRKMMLVLPLLVFPFLTMAFWALGGGAATGKNTTAKTAGLNLDLPDAHLKDDSTSNKLSFYDRADKDLAKRGELEKSDPYFKLKTDTAAPVSADLSNMTTQTATKYNQRLNTSPYQAPNDNAEEKLMAKLAMLQQEMSKPVTGEKTMQTDVKSKEDTDAFSAQINRLEGMMQGATAQGSEDPEMSQMNKALDKILDIQHPQRVQNRLQEKSAKEKGNVFKVSKSFQLNRIGLLDTPKTNIATIGFYGIEPWPEQTVEDNSIEAVVNGNQTLVSGAVLQLRLANDIYISGRLVPKGTTISGNVSLNGERLEAEINSIRSGKSLFPISLQLYDMDGLAGLFIPGSIGRDAAAGTVDNNLQLLEMSSMDPSLKAQAAAAGIGAAKNLLSRKVKLVRVTVKSGYKVLLKSKDN